MTSIFSRDVTGSLDPSPRELIADEIMHLEGVGRSCWRTTPLMTTCRLVASFLFLGVIALYFLDPFLYGYHKTRAIHAYLYLAQFGKPNAIQELSRSGMFSPREVKSLDLLSQTNTEADVQTYFLGTIEAEKTLAEASRYMHEVNALHSGDLTHASKLTEIRYQLFRSMGVIPPREWEALNPPLETN